MRQLAFLGVAALSAVALVGIGCSSSDNKGNNEANGGGGAANEGGSPSTGGRSSSSAGTSAGATNGGTSPTASAGGAHAAAGSAGTAPGAAGGSTSAGAPGAGGAVQLTAGENIINDTCEVNGGPEVMGVMGGFYVFGDSNADHPNGQSCVVPPSGTKPCKAVEGVTTSAVCLSGATIKDATYAAWGCGIGLSLHSSNTATNGTAGAAGAAGAAGVAGADSGIAGAGGTTGAAGAAGAGATAGTADTMGTAGAAGAAGKSEQLTYSGPATCFELTFTGTTGGLTLRVGFTQYADPSIKTQSVAPFKTLRAFTNGWTGKVCFEDVICPNWPTAPGQGCPANLVATPSSSYDMQIQVPGGDGANTYDFCLTKVVPLKPMTP